MNPHPFVICNIKNQRKPQDDYNTIFRERVSKLSSKYFYQNSASDTRFEIEVPPSHIRHALDSHVFLRSPRTGITCITSSAASPSCLPILKSNERETVKVFFFEKRCVIEGNMYRIIDYKHERNGESQMHHDKLYTGIILHAIYYVSCKQSAR